MEMNIDDAPTYTRLHYKPKVKARKEHKCDLCDKTIKVGQMYVSHVYKLDDEIQAQKHHAENCLSWN